MSQDATGVPLRPEHAARERMVVGDDALGLERREDRRVAAARRGARRRRCRGARRGRRRSPVAARRDAARRPARPAPSGGAIGEVGNAPARAARARAVGARAAPALRRAARGARRRAGSSACLHARFISSTWSESRCTVWVETGDVGERGREVEILERAAAAHLRRHLARDREHRRPVDLGVVQTGEQVRGARARDREARRELPGELAVRARRERGRALVADADEREVAALLGARIASAKPRFEWPTMPNTCVTPHATIVSTMRSETVRARGALGRQRRRRRRRRAPRPDGSPARR